MTKPIIQYDDREMTAYRRGLGEGRDEAIREALHASELREKLERIRKIIDDEPDGLQSGLLSRATI